LYERLLTISSHIEVSATSYRIMLPLLSLGGGWWAVAARIILPAPATYQQYTEQDRIVSGFDSRCRSSLCTSAASSCHWCCVRRLFG